MLLDVSLFYMFQRRGLANAKYFTHIFLGGSIFKGSIAQGFQINWNWLTACFTFLSRTNINRNALIKKALTDLQVVAQNSDQNEIELLNLSIIIKPLEMQKRGIETE